MPKNRSIVVVTGANSGIGKETTRSLAARGATVVMACRDAGRAAAARAEIVATAPDGIVEVMQLDLASFASIRGFAEDFRARFPRLDVLVNNAGLMPLTRQSTAEGFEMQIGVNHLGHVLLTDLLRPALLASERKRVVVVASMMHRFGRIDLDSFRGDGPYHPMRAYCQSKLANVLFAREYARRETEGVTIFSLHPGAVGTSIAGRSLLRRTLYRVFGGWMSPKRGARTTIHLASEPTVDAPNGSYFDQSARLKPGSAASRDPALAGRLWEESWRMIREASTQAR